MTSTTTYGLQARRRYGGRRLHLVPYAASRGPGGAGIRIHDRSLCGLATAELTCYGGNPDVCVRCADCSAAEAGLSGAGPTFGAMVAAAAGSPLPGVAEEPPLPEEADASIDPEYWSLSDADRKTFLRKTDHLERLIEAAHRGTSLPKGSVAWFLEDAEWEPEETYLNLVDDLPSLDGGWASEFGFAGAAVVLDPDRQGVIYWQPDDDADDESTDDDADAGPTDEELQLLAAWWVDFVAGNEDYRWDYDDASIVRLRSRRSAREAWLVVVTEWDAGIEADPVVAGGYPTLDEARAALGKIGFLSGDEVTPGAAAAMRPW